MTTVVFPGQGSQYTGMSKDFYDNFAIARERFEIAEETSRIKIKDIVFQNKSNIGNRNLFQKKSNVGN